MGLVENPSGREIALVTGGECIVLALAGGNGVCIKVWIPGGIFSMSICLC